MRRREFEIAARLVSSEDTRCVAPRSGDELLEVLRSHHSVLMAARPDTHEAASEDLGMLQDQGRGGALRQPTQLPVHTRKNGVSAIDALTRLFEGDPWDATPADLNT